MMKSISAGSLADYNENKVVPLRRKSPHVVDQLVNKHKKNIHIRKTSYSPHTQDERPLRKSSSYSGSKSNKTKSRKAKKK